MKRGVNLGPMIDGVRHEIDIEELVSSLWIRSRDEGVGKSA